MFIKEYSLKKYLIRILFGSMVNLPHCLEFLKQNGFINLELSKSHFRSSIDGAIKTRKVDGAAGNGEGIAEEKEIPSALSFFILPQRLLSHSTDERK